jgi:hypothetical protein
MSDAVLLRQAGLFFASEKWWRPILSFVFTNCSAFYADNPTHDEFVIHQSFIALVTDLVDNEFCRKSHITPLAFENVMFSSQESGDPQAKIMVDTMEKATDFLEFRSQMISCNVSTELIVSQVLGDFCKAHPEVTDPDEISAAVADAVQAKIDNELSDLVRRGAAQMRILLELDRPEDESSEAEGESEPDDVERRRRFFAKQRDLLQEQEMAVKKSQTPVRPPHHGMSPNPARGKHRTSRTPSKT